MILRGLSAVVAIGLVVLAGCDDLKAPSNTRGPENVGDAAGRDAHIAFAHQIEGDLSGYYIPATAIAVSGYRIKALFLGQDADFAAWEGGSKSDSFGPVMIEFERIDGGGVNGGGVIRVLPKSYAVTDGRVRFEGVDAHLGQVAFDGTLDAAALATARRNLGDEAPVLSGTLRAGGTAFSGQKFRWYGGD